MTTIKITTTTAFRDRINCYRPGALRLPKAVKEVEVHTDVKSKQGLVLSVITLTDDPAAGWGAGSHLKGIPERFWGLRCWWLPEVLVDEYLAKPETAAAGRYGPNTDQVEAFLVVLSTFSDAQWFAARVAEREALEDWDTYVAASRAAWDAVGDEYAAAASSAAWMVKGGTAGGVAVAVAAWGHDGFTRSQFELLTAPARAVGINFKEDK